MKNIYSLTFYIFLVAFCFFASFKLSAQTQWQLLNPYPTNNDIFSLSFPSTDRGFMIDGWNLFRTDDAGVTWKKLKKHGWVRSVTFMDNDHGWISSGDSLYYTSDGGESWNARFVTNDACIDNIYWYNDEIGFVYGDIECFIAKTIDGGDTWQTIDFFASAIPDYEASVKQVEFIDSENGYALIIESDNSYFYHTQDGGESWNSVSLPDAMDMMTCFDLLNTDNIWIGEGKANNSFTDTIATAFHSIDGGTTWSSHDIGKAQTRPIRIGGIKFFNAMQGQAFESGHIYKTNDGGITWSDYNVKQIFDDKLYRNLDVISIVDQMHCFYGGSGPLLISTSDGGQTYDNLIQGCTEHNWAVHFTDSLNGCVGSTDFTQAHLRYTNDGGETWNLAVTDTIPEYLYDIDFASKEIGWFVSFQHLFKTVDGGKTWKAKKVPFPNSLYYVSSPDTGHVFMKGFNYMLKTDDSGNTWTDIAIPGLDLFKDNDGPFQFTDSLTGYISYYNWDSDLSTLYKTVDGGETWEILPTGPLEMVRSMSFADNLHGVMFDWMNGMQVTKDGGYTWERISGFFAQENVRMIDTLTIIGSSGSVIFGDIGDCGNFITVSHDGGTTFEEFNYPGYSFNSQPVTYCLNERNAFSVGNYGTIQRLGYVTPLPPIGLPEQDASAVEESVFYPNPTTGIIKIKDLGYTTLTITSLSGNSLYIIPLTTNQVNVSMLPPGIYLLTLSSPTKHQTEKLVKF